jgi:hypothetical protein
MATHRKILPIAAGLSMQMEDLMYAIVVGGLRFANPPYKSSG